MTPEQYAYELIRRLAEHFGIKTLPRVRVGCEGCPYYDHARRRCTLGFVACYNPATKTITFSSPAYINELVATHELLHYVLDVAGRRGYGRIGIRLGSDGGGVSTLFAFIGTMATLAGLRLAYEAVKRRR